VDKLLEQSRMRCGLSRLEDETANFVIVLGKHELVVPASNGGDEIVGADRARRGERDACCILGDTGTAKELWFARRAIHEKSPAEDHHSFNHPELRGVPVELIESELFGHEKGDYGCRGPNISASSNKAESGTLFLE